jgi:hypothetical protein
MTTDMFHLLLTLPGPFLIHDLPRRLPLVGQELPTLREHLSFSGVRVTRYLLLCVCFVDRCLSFFFWLLCCLSFFDLRILITLLVSSNSSSKIQ